jgi:hypothetical protein
MTTDASRRDPNGHGRGLTLAMAAGVMAIVPNA